MRAELKRLHSPDVSDLSEYRPVGPFGFLVQAMIAPFGLEGEESFDFVLCTAEWFSAHMSARFELGRHYLFVKEYEYSALIKFVSEYCSSCEAENWTALAEKLGRLGKWEFEDYTD